MGSLIQTQVVYHMLVLISSLLFSTSDHAIRLSPQSGVGQKKTKYIYERPSISMDFNGDPKISTESMDIYVSMDIH